MSRRALSMIDRLRARLHRVHRAAWVAVGVVLAGLVASLALPARPPVVAQSAGGIAFSDTVTGTANRDIFEVQPDGTGRRTLAGVPDARDQQPSWSPDGRNVAFTTQLPDGLWAVARADAASGAIRLLTNGPGDLEPDWSADGMQIAFSSYLPNVNQVERSTITVMSPDGISQRPVVELISSTYVVASPSWSPDGKHIAFVLRSDSAGGEIYVTNVDGTGTHRLFAHPGWDDLDPAWSPDGRRIAFAAGPYKSGQGADRTLHAIWMLDVTNGTVGSVYVDPNLDLRRPSWSPMGTQLVMDGHKLSTTGYQLYIAPAAGGVLFGPITVGAEADWGPAVPPSPTPGTGTASLTPPATATFPSTSTPPPVPIDTPPPTLPPFPTIPPLEPSPTGPPPTFAWPTATSTPTASASPSPTASATATLPLSPTASPSATPSAPASLFLPWLESPGVPE
jgi:hypothetical protein